MKNETSTHSVVYRILRSPGSSDYYGENARGAAEGYRRILEHFPEETPVIEKTIEITTKSYKKQTLTIEQLEETLGISAKK